MKRLSNKEVKQVLDKISVYGDFSKKDRFEIDNNLIFINGKPAFFLSSNNIVPTLRYITEHPILQKIVVDMGAIRFVINGADIMRPGITHIDKDILKNEFIIIVDEIHRKPLAIGQALFSGKEMQAMKSGKVVKNLHYVGDGWWNHH